MFVLIPMCNLKQYAHWVFLLTHSQTKSFESTLPLAQTPDSLVGH